MIKDPIVQDVVDRFISRSEVGQKKYGTTLYENNQDDFLNHAIEESMDFILYLHKIKQQLKEKGYSKLSDI
jgi:hypothetical protein